MKSPRAILATAMVAIICGAFALAVSSHRRPPSPNLTLAEQEVIEAVLSQIEMQLLTNHVILDFTTIKDLQRDKDYGVFSKQFRESHPDTRHWTTRLYDLFHGHRDRYKDALPRAVADFLRKNADRAQIDFRADLALRARLVSETSVMEIFDRSVDSPWKLFRRRFPNASGFLKLSRVGISPDNLVAIVYMGEYNGPMSGRGNVYILHRNGAKWVLHATQMVWVS